MNKLLGAALVMACLVATVGNGAMAADSGDYAFGPIKGSSRGVPQIMLALSFDHELFKKVYNDYSDIDGDGLMDVTYKDSFRYAGYFESDWCYTYSVDRFRPSERASGTNKHTCTGGKWSGNFMNWATMSRMDLVRKMIYGGKRSTDTASLTVLERAEIPNDWHAFNKVYDVADSGGPDLWELTPLTGTAIALCSASHSARGTPYVSVRKADVGDPYSNSSSWKTTVDSWGNGGSLLCGGTSEAKFKVRVEVCHALSTSSDCQTYGSSKKPIGLMQRRQDDVHFGLITGSYDKNVSGGVVRKNISSASDEVNQSTGQFILNNGIVANINRFRMTEWPYAAEFMECGGSGPSGCNPVWSEKGLSYACRTEPLPCRDWGNPIAEIYLEALRYFAGQSSPSSEYAVGTDLNLSKASWEDPLSVSNACSNCSIILLSTGQNSYDHDDLASLTDVMSGGLTALKAATDRIGELEPSLTFPGTYVVGEQVGVDDGSKECVPRSVDKLSKARGICPEAPIYEGSYYLAGLSHFAFTNDLRSSLSGGQNINTYVVELAKTIPALNFAVPTSGGGSRTVSINPICQASNGLNRSFMEIPGISRQYEKEYFPCAFLDAKVRDYEVNTDGVLTSISFRVFWQDFLWGGDGDADAEATYTVAVSEDNIKVTISDVVTRAGYSLRYTYSISGVEDYNGIVTDADYNSHYTGTNQSYDDGDNESAIIIYQGRLLDGFSRNPTCGFAYGYKCKWATPTTVTKNFTPSNNLSGTLPTPLFLAAKYSGFTDLDNDGSPNYDGNRDGTPDNDSREWDNVNNVTGAAVPDGIPDNYFFSDNPDRLNTQLNDLLENIANAVSSTAPPAVSSNADESRLLIQTLFRSEETVNNLNVSWVGWLYGLFIDLKGHIREDSNRNRRLDDYDTDRVVTVNYNTVTGTTQIQRWSSADNGDTLTALGGPASFTALNTVWDARQSLQDLTNTTTQRSYTATADTGRHILTWLDANNNGSVSASELKPFVSSSFSGANAGYLGVSSGEETKLVNYIRGEDQTGFRSRSVDMDGDGTKEVWRLGDIINTSLVHVGAPKGNYSRNISYGTSDSTFNEFRAHYENRREVIYTGGNDGMLHAFNGGFWNNALQQFDLTHRNSEPSHPLGTELWAYVPMNLLPHLRWLTEVNYPHVPYMDGELHVFDANIFPDDADHPKGWGTVLVAAMGMGGGPIDVTVSGTTRTMRSSHVIFDITNPEKPPVLMAEINTSDLGFTKSPPVVVRQRQPDTDGSYETPSRNDWYLVFGSGPIGTGTSGTRQALSLGTSNQNMRLYVYDLKTLSPVSPFNPMVTSIPASYAGEMTVVDWEHDGFDDTIYLGSVRTTGNLSGELLRLTLGGSSPAAWQLRTVTNPQRPITGPPNGALTQDGERWVYAGTGRDLVKTDRISTQQEYFFGVREVRSGTTFTGAEVPFSDLIDTTDVQVRANGDLVSSFTVEPGTTVSTFDALAQAVNSRKGWLNKLDTNGANPNNKSLNASLNTLPLIFFIEYSPPTNQCSIVDSSLLNAVSFQTGTAYPAEKQRVLTPEGFLPTDISVKKINLGAGQFTDPRMMTDSKGNSKIITQGGYGNINSTDIGGQSGKPGRQSWRRIFDIPQN